MVKADTGLGKGGGGCPDHGTDILGSDSFGPVVYMDDDAAHLEGLGRIPPQGVPQADSDTTSEKEVRSLDIPPAGGHNG